MKVVDTGHIVVEPDVLGGEPHIAGHRIAVSHIAIWIIYQNESPRELAKEFNLTLGEIYAALAYYYDHKDEVDRTIAVTSERAEDMAERYPKGWSFDKEGA